MSSITIRGRGWPVNTALLPLSGEMLPPPPLWRTGGANTPRKHPEKAWRLDAFLLTQYSHTYSTVGLFFLKGSLGVHRGVIIPQRTRLGDALSHLLQHASPQRVRGLSHSPLPCPLAPGSRCEREWILFGCLLTRGHTGPSDATL